MTPSNKIKKQFFSKNYNAEEHPVAWDQQTINQASKLIFKTLETLLIF